MKRYIYTSLFLLNLIFLSCNNSTSTSAEVEQNEDKDLIEITSKQFETAQLELGYLKQNRFSEQFQVTGMIDVPPENRATVSSYFDGYISETQLLVGSEVQKGDLLVKLKHPDFIKMQQNYVESFSNLEFQTSEFERKKNLLEDKVIAQKVFQSTKNDYLQAKAQLQATFEQIKLMNLNPKEIAKGNFTSEIRIYAPISGKISKLNVSQGKFLSKSEMIMEILDVDHIHLELNVFEKDILKIHKGDTLSFKIPEISDQIFSAYVKLIGAEVNENRSVRVHAHPKNENVNFSVGMFVNSYFKSNSKDYLALPETAFTEVDGETFVLQLDSKTDNLFTFKKIEVKTNAPQKGLKPILNSEQIDTEAQFLTRGVFDIITTGGGGHSH
ncbi:efflux RND transporter periplasmic adaptor subunit [Psychroflexus sp. MES1-P1E]|uniref:efflux RND transporter periplasmic adaptor subunit n=1 Tax=Psychroflexus sp. MES1-P1E TaxID=2058320 RepID=UPI000C797536|nr:efflux RND transporter periplasmic adaptor subunit [Psychroflexus sp. MES1-P1E]PKG42989.1 efflux RND transporter periplasmic adaptor subunit [Psychroflexus sp. MES1-P1E]